VMQHYLYHTGTCLRVVTYEAGSSDTEPVRTA
jgi:hypothetical protein